MGEIRSNESSVELGGKKMLIVWDREGCWCHEVGRGYNNGNHWPAVNRDG